MRRRAFIIVIGLIGALAVLWTLAAHSQQNDRVRALEMRILHLQAEGAAEKIGHFIKEIENQMGWTTQLTWSAAAIEQRKFDAKRLLRQVPAVTEFAQVDPTGKEGLRASRLAPDFEGDGHNYSHDPKFIEAVVNKVYYGPVYLRRQSEAYVTLSVAGTRRDAGVSVAEVNLKLILDIVKGMKVGEHGVAYVLDAQDRVIAHSNMFVDDLDAQNGVVEHFDFSLFQRDFSNLTQVQAARAAGSGPVTGAVQIARDFNGREVLTAYAPVARPNLGWLVLVELPVEDANSKPPQ
jgi:two-component system, NtrC family, sensor kinase